MTIFITEYHNNPVKSIVFSLDGKTFVSISIGAIYIYNLETGYSILDLFELKDMNSYRANASFNSDIKC